MRQSARLVVALAALLAACGSSNDPNAFARAELSRHRTQWHSAALHDYAYDFQIAANLAPAVTQPVRITVTADHVTRVVNRFSGAEVSITAYPWPTIDDLFDRADQALASGDVLVTITYDATLGYPTHIVVPERTPDSGWSATAGNLTAATL